MVWQSYEGLHLIEICITSTSLTVSEMVPSFFLRTSDVFTVSDSIVFWRGHRNVCLDLTLVYSYWQIQCCVWSITNIFPSGLFQRIRLLQFFGLFAELLDVFFHFFVLVKLLLKVVQKLPQETFSATTSLTWQVPYLQEGWLRHLVGGNKNQGTQFIYTKHD